MLNWNLLKSNVQTLCISICSAGSYAWIHNKNCVSPSELRVVHQLHMASTVTCCFRSQSWEFFILDCIIRHGNCPWISPQINLVTKQNIIYHWCIWSLLFRRNILPHCLFLCITRSLGQCNLNLSVSHSLWTIYCHCSIWQILFNC